VPPTAGFAVRATSDSRLVLLKKTYEPLTGVAAPGLLVGLARGLSADEIAAFKAYNTAYYDRFGFPFVICARENKKDAILEAFPARLALDADEERAAALVEIGRIRWLWLVDAVTEL